MARDPDLGRKIRDAAIGIIQGLGLQEIQKQNVLAKLVEEDTTAGRPCCLVTSQGLAEESTPGTTESQDLLCQFHIILLDTQSAALDARDPLYRKWRKQIADALASPAGKVALKAVVPAVYRTDVSITAVTMRTSYLLAVSSLLLKVWARENQ